MHWLQGVSIVLALWGTSAAFGYAGDDTRVNEDDVKALTPLDGHARKLQPWRGGIIFRVVRGPWLIASWDKPEAQPLLPIAGVKVLDVCRNKSGHFACARSVGETVVLLLKEDGSQEKVLLPDTLAEASNARFIPCNTGLALGADEVVWWQRDSMWNSIQVIPCPSMIRGYDPTGAVDPLGDVNFIKNGFLYSGSEGGEFGGAFAWYDLSQSKGSWGLVWRGRDTISVQRIFQDSKGVLWAFAHLGHLGIHQYSLHRGIVSRWETLLSNSLSGFGVPQNREVYPLLQKDSFVVDAAPMPDGRIALLAEDDGIYLKGDGDCPCLFHFKFRRDDHWCATRCLCFDDSGNAYVNTPSQGLLVFHKEPSGPWRVKQIKMP